MSEGVRESAKKPEASKEDRTSETRKSDYSQPVNSSIDRILFLQRTIGNQAVGRLIKYGALQTKLKIGQPNDIYEQEADRVAEQVMRIPAPVQRKCPKCETELKRQPEKEEEEAETLQAKEASSPTSEVVPELECRINSIKGGGRPLPESTRSFFEPRFGRDFSQVRLHADEKAAELARAVNARAFTVGRDVVFGEGEYAPGTLEGERLISHELTHVVQQQMGSVGMDVVRRLPDPDCDTVSARPLTGSSGAFIHTFYTPSFKGAGSTINIVVSVDYYSSPPPGGPEDFRVSIWQCHLVWDESVAEQLSSGLPDTVMLAVNLPDVSWNTYDAFYVKVYSRSHQSIRVNSFSIT